MKRCDPTARARCPDGKNCELYAEFADGSECDKFNEKVLATPESDKLALCPLCGSTSEYIVQQLQAEKAYDATVFCTACGCTLRERLFLPPWTKNPVEEAKRQIRKQWNKRVSV